MKSVTHLLDEYINLFSKYLRYRLTGECSVPIPVG